MRENRAKRQEKPYHPRWSRKPAPTTLHTFWRIDMGELLYKIGQIFKAMFSDWIPKLANADLGIIGTISTAIAIVSIFAYKITKRKHR